MTLHELNELPRADAQQAMLQCCGSHRWARLMTEQRPFAAVEDLLQAAERCTFDMAPQDWLEAFAAHPRIGERSESAWSQAEQAAALSAEDQIKQQLARANAEYQQKFGFIFIVFASGKTPEQVLELMKVRMDNPRVTEMAIAAAEQKKITHARLHKLLGL